MNKVIFVLLPCLCNPGRGGTFSSDMIFGMCIGNSRLEATHSQAAIHGSNVPSARQAPSQHLRAATPPLIQFRSFGCFQDLNVDDSSPSSMRVHRGSSTMVNVDEDTSEDGDGEPRLLRYDSVTAEDEPVEVKEPLCVEKYIRPLGEGEVQKIVKSEAEDEIVVVDDYLEDREAVKTEDAVKAEAVKAEDPSREETGESEQQKKVDLAEAAQETSQTDSETETKTDQSFESAQEEQDDSKENGEKGTDDKPLQEGKTLDKKTEAQAKDGEEAKQYEKPNKNNGSSSSDSSDDFVEVQPEEEKVQNAELVTSQVNPQQKEEGASGGDKVAAPVKEVKMDMKQYYLRKKPSVPPPLPPKEKHYF